MPDAPGSFSGIAFNQATASENRIHADDVARRFGFRGGLVPGVTVHAYLVEPAIRSWGRDFLERGAASIVLKRPLYDGEPFRVVLKTDGARGYRGRVLDRDDVECAEGGAWLPDEAPDAPTLRGDAPAPDPAARPPATRETLERLREAGLGSLRLPWTGRGELDRSYATFDPMPDLIRPDRGGLASPAFTLGLANWLLSHNLRLGPWIHAGSEVRYLGAVPLGSELHVEGRITDLFSRGGHEFVDLDVAVFHSDHGDRPVLHADHRAIYQLREP